MPAVLRDLVASPLSEAFDLHVIPTWRPGGAAGRVAVFAGALARLVAFCLGRGRRVVHIHVTVRGSMYRKAIATLAAKALRRPVILHVHGGADELDEFWTGLDGVSRRLAHAAHARADRVVSVSVASARVLEQRYGARNTVVLPNPAPRPGPERPDTPAEPPEVLYLGGFADPVKGGRVLLAAAPAIVRDAPGTTISFAGPGEPPAALTAGEGLRWLGFLDAPAKAAALARARVFVLPSTSEGLPVALLEAMAAGCPIVATRMGGVPDVVTDGEDALVVAPGDPDALAAAIGRLLADPGRARALGQGARRRVAEISPERIAEQLGVLYREVAAA
jgi:glycosyltransferase involved in cell wall biosynthesis